MGSEFIERAIDCFSIRFEDSSHDVMTTTGQGLILGISEIRFGNEPTSFSGGVLYVHIDGDPTKFQVSEQSFGQTFVKSVAFSDMSSGLERIDAEPQEGTGETVVVVMIDSNMPDSTLARAGITATEAITAAVQDLGMRYSSTRPSGCRRQHILTIRNGASILYLRNAGKHSKLGELIGTTVIESVKESAAANGVDMTTRRSVVGMLSGYGCSQDDLQKLSGCPDPGTFLVKVITKDSEPEALLAVSAVLHIYDNVVGGLFPEQEGLKAAQNVLRAGLREPVGFGSILEILFSTVAAYFMDP